MVSIILNKQKLLKEIGIEQESDDLIHQIAMMGVEVDEVTDDALTVDITPDRPDLLSQPGFTRALSSFLDVKTGLRNYTVTKSKLKVRVDSSAKDIRPYTACAVVKNLKLNDELLREIIDLQEKLHITFCRNRKKAAIGVYPMEAIKGNITFKALPPNKIKFRPLESTKQMTAKEILEKHPKGKEFAYLLEGLPMYPLFVDGKNNVLSMPPVINSHSTGKVTEKTKQVFIEASGHDFKTCHDIIRIICAALADMGATIQTVDVIYSGKPVVTPDMSPTKQEFYRYYVNRRLGTELKKEDLSPLLAKMGLGFQDGRIRETHYALIPPYRVDFLHQIDVVEDLAIALGYDNIKPVLPDVNTVASESHTTLFADKIRSILAGQLMLEAKNYHLMNSSFQKSIKEEDVVTLKSSVSEEHDSLRKTILPGLLQTLTRNKIHEYPQMLFELGRVFAPAKNAVNESEGLGIVLAGETDYTKIRQSVDALLLSLGLKGEYVPADDGRFLAGRCAHLLIKGEEVGVIGEVNPRVLELSELVVPVAAAELNLDLLQDTPLE
ncbi:phenylalanine--tRNA ligase subunit beta [Candidatus Woesearchaeota archaeon]|nr:phenylalanine--tRNA ligase subunit beta [Candidatus Woesearchaeota archaeon]